MGLRDWDGNANASASASGNENASNETGTASARQRKNPPRGARPSLGVNGDAPLSHLDTIPSRPPSPPYTQTGSPIPTQTQNQSYPPPAASTQTGTGSRPVVTRKRRSSSIKRKPSPGKVPEKVVDWEIPRKTFHSSIGFLTLYLNHLTPPSLSPLLAVLSALLLFVLVTDLPRLWFPASRYAELWEACVGFLMRESEREKVNGVVWYLIGVIFVLGLYPRDVGVVAILLYVFFFLSFLHSNMWLTNRQTDYRGQTQQPPHSGVFGVGTPPPFHPTFPASGSYRSHLENPSLGSSRPPSLVL